MTRTAIIGAGASGLSLALLLEGDVTIFEAGHRPGGHAAATKREGWTFDRGPHIMFSKNAEVLNFMIRSLKGNVHQSRRNNRVCIEGSFAKYPIENDLGSLPDNLRNQCLLSFLFNEHAHLGKAPANLYEWFLGTFGAGLTDLYFKPYNEKIWVTPLSDLSMTWSERIPQPPAVDVVKGALGISTEGYLHQLNFHYPLVGGYEAIPASWSEMLPAGWLRLDTPVEHLNPVPGGVEVTSRFGVEHFDRVVCTAPMPGLLSLVDNAPDLVRDAVDALQINGIAVVTLGFRGIDPHGFTAVYFPDPEYLVNRVSAPCIFSPRNGPVGSFSLQAEITAKGRDVFNLGTDDQLIEHVLAGFVRHGLVRQDTPLVFADVSRFEHAYVVYTVDYEHRVRTVSSWAESLGLFLHGRFGAFDYLNVDGCVERSLTLASRLNGRPASLPSLDVDDEVRSG